MMAIDSSALTVQPLTFPALPFAKLAPSTFLNAHLTTSSGPIRPSGRRPSETRVPTVNTGSLTHAHGSAVVKCGDTAVVCGVRGEILRVEDIADGAPKVADDEIDSDDRVGNKMKKRKITTESDQRTNDQRRKQQQKDLARLNLLVPNVELATGCSPANLPGGPPSTQAQVLSQRLLVLLYSSNLIQLSDLRIWFSPQSQDSTSPSSSSAGNPTAAAAAEKEEKGQDQGLDQKQVKAYWTLYIDILFLSLSGPPFDCAWLALLAALKNTRLPHAEYDADRDAVFCSPEWELSHALRMDDIPVALTFGVFAGEDDNENGREVMKKGDDTDGTKRKEGKQYILADMDGFEEVLCQETATVVVGERGQLVRLEKSGGGRIGVGDIRELVELTGRWRGVWLETLEAAETGRGEG